MLCVKVDKNMVILSISELNMTLGATEDGLIFLVLTNQPSTTGNFWKYSYVDVSIVTADALALSTRPSASTMLTHYFHPCRLLFANFWKGSQL